MKNRNLFGYKAIFKALDNLLSKSKTKQSISCLAELSSESDLVQQPTITSSLRHSERSEESNAFQINSSVASLPQDEEFFQSSIFLLPNLKKCIKSAFSLVEILIALIIVSVVMAALAPVITKKIKSSGVTIGGGGGSGVPSAGACGMGQYFDMDEQACKHCPEGHFCDGFNKLVCLAGTSTSADGTDKHPLNGQSQCKECADGYYALEASPTCILNTAVGCAEKSKIDNACISCENAEDLLVDGNCVKDVPVYTLLNDSGSDITETDTELTKGDTYWYLKIKSTGTLTFSTVPANVMDVFMVGGGAGGQSYVWGECEQNASGGGSYNILKNIVVQTGIPYPIKIGAGGGVTACTALPSNGGTTSAFGTYSHGGVRDGSHSICPFNDASCDQKYGASGSSSNQIANTGSGGKAASKGMSGVVIIRGRLGASNVQASTIPSYRFLNDSGSDITYSDVTLSVTNEYWYMKFANSGTLTFGSLPNNFIDVFAVGGGSGGTTYVWGECNEAVSGGGNYNIVKDVAVSIEKSYPVKIGAGSGTVQCTSNRSNGNTSNAFGVFAAGGVYTSDHSICPFGDASCDYKYGVPGTDANQNHNTGNGGTKAKPGMSGAIVIRGKRTIGGSSPTIPTYKFLSTSGTDVTTQYSTLNISGDYWYLKFTNSGSVNFDYLPTNYVDVFTVGGGAGGTTYVWGECEQGVAGGGTYNIVKDAYISAGPTYPINIGGGGSVVACTSKPSNGGASSGFGVHSRGGLKTQSYSLCHFGDSTCTYTYGNTGGNSNQNPNTGNGGAAAKTGMSGTVMIRGKLNGSSSLSEKIPTYTLTDSAGSDITESGSILSVTNTYWYIKFTKTGTLKFNSIKNPTIDVFAVGGGAGGTTYVWGECDEAVSGGGNYNIATNINVVAGDSYPIVIGAGGGTIKCTSTRKTGGASSGFGVSAAGGSGTTAHKVCSFNGTDCSVYYGEKGSNGNQFQNTGNGGTSAYSGMNGTVIIRGAL